MADEKETTQPFTEEHYSELVEEVRVLQALRDTLLQDLRQMAKSLEKATDKNIIFEEQVEDLEETIKAMELKVKNFDDQLRLALGNSELASQDVEVATASVDPVDASSLIQGWSTIVNVKDFPVLAGQVWLSISDPNTFTVKEIMSSPERALGSYSDGGSVELPLDDIRFKMVMIVDEYDNQVNRHDRYSSGDILFHFGSDESIVLHFCCATFSWVREVGDAGPQRTSPEMAELRCISTATLDADYGVSIPENKG